MEAIDEPLQIECMQKMAVIDLDDTLLSPDKSISSANLQALRTLRENGFEIIIGSGRHHENIVRFEDRIGRQGWVISSNGAVVRHARTSVLLHERTLTLQQALDVCRYGAERDLTVVGYHRHGAFTDQNSEWTLRYALGAGWHRRRGNQNELAAESGFKNCSLFIRPRRSIIFNRISSGDSEQRCMLSAPKTKFWR